MLENLAVPDFEAPATGGNTFRLKDARGKPLVLYFYPKDNTPGCTDEGMQFRDLYPQFQELGCAIYGIPRDSLKSHENFKAKQAFPFELQRQGRARANVRCDQAEELYGKEYGR
jgi:peroxiredoxin Q/BCP